MVFEVDSDEDLEEVLGAGDYIDNGEFENEICGICLDTVIDRGVLDCCDHWFCFPCIDNWASITNLCPLCKTEFQLITCLPVYDVLGNNFKINECSFSRDSDWSVQEESNTLSFPSYYINEDAVKCLDGDSCKVWSRLPTNSEELNLDTSIACDSCDTWYHALCVGFDPANASGNSWLCPRCTIDEAPESNNQKCASHAHITESTFNGKVAISVADDGETAVVLSIIEGKQPTEAIVAVTAENASVVEVIDDKTHVEESTEPDAYGAKLDACQYPSCSNEFPQNSMVHISASQSFENVAPTLKHCDFTDLHRKATATSDTTLPAKLLSSPTDNTTFSGKMPVTEVSESSFEVVNLKSRLARLTKSKSQKCDPLQIEVVNTSDHLTKRKNSQLAEENYSTKKARLCDSSQTTSLSRDKSQNHHDADINSKDEIAANHAAKKNIKPDIMSIVQGFNWKSSNDLEASHSADIRSNTSGPRVKKIMRITENKESSILVQKLREEIKDVVHKYPSKDFGKDDALDGKLLEAFRSAIARPRSELNNKPDPSLVKRKKTLLQKGKVRENLTKKIYGSTSGKRRRAWDRDWEIEFWKHRCLGAKPEKVETLQSVLDLLKKISSSENSEIKEELEGEDKNGILSRVYLADTSVFPRMEDIKPLSSLAGSSTSINVATKIKEPIVSFCMGIDSSPSPAEVSHTTCPSISTSKENDFSRFKGELHSRKEHLTGPKSRGHDSLSLETIPERHSKLETDHSVTGKIDKRKWALEILARKNAMSNINVHEGCEEDINMLKGSYPLVAQLPADMRPVPSPCQHSKIPLSVRQAQLYRLTEFYLKKVNLPTIRRTADTELAVADAVNIEREIFNRSNSRLVYVNLCSQHTIDRKLQAVANVSSVHSALRDKDTELYVSEAGTDPESARDSIEEALKLTGLFSDSPPDSPNQFTESLADMEAINKTTAACCQKFHLDSSDQSNNHGRFDHDLEREVLIASSCASVNLPLSNMQSEDGDLKMVVALPFEEIVESGNDLMEGKHTNVHAVGGLDGLPVPIDPSTSPCVLASEGAKAMEHRCLVSGRSSSEKVVALLLEEKDEKSSQEISVPENKFSSGPLHEKNQVKDEISAGFQDWSCDAKNITVEKSPDKVERNRCEHSSSHHMMSHNAVKVSESDPNTYRPSDPSNVISLKVEAYIKEHIRPLCKSGIITAEQYRWAVGKTTEKIMKFHCKAKNANFVIKEGDKIKKLADQYVEAAQQKYKKQA